MNNFEKHSNVMSALLDSNCVTFPNWDNDEYIFLVQGETIKKAINDQYGDPEKEPLSIPVPLIFKHSQGNLYPYTLTTEDLISDFEYLN